MEQIAARHIRQVCIVLRRQSERRARRRSPSRMSRARKSSHCTFPRVRRTPNEWHQSLRCAARPSEEPTAVGTIRKQIEQLVQLHDVSLTAATVRTRTAPRSDRAAPFRVCPQRLSGPAGFRCRLKLSQCSTIQVVTRRVQGLETTAAELISAPSVCNRQVSDFCSDAPSLRGY
jgi:hypothetical protein